MQCVLRTIYCHNLQKDPNQAFLQTYKSEIVMLVVFGIKQISRHFKTAIEQ